MNRMRSVFNNFMKNERYSRFTLQTEQDGERRVEVKLSEDGLDGDAEANPGGSPTFRPAPRGQNRKNICFLLVATLLIFIIGYMVGYLIHGRPKVSQSCENNTVYRVATSVPFVPFVPREEPAPSLSWVDITKLLENKLNSETFTKTLSEFDKVSPRSAGSYEDSRLGNRIIDQFKQLDMKPWNDIHYVRLQTPDENKPNTVTFGSDIFKPKGYLAFSGTGIKTGKLVYANYGLPEDFAVLASNKVEMEGSVVMMRCGKISFAQKVANAEGKGAVAVLIHPDNKDMTADNEVYGHVHFGSGDPYTPGFPSFNQTMFPPTNSSGLPKIPAQTITYNNADKILQAISGPSGFGRSLGGIKNITVEVNNVLGFKEIHNVFGVIKGFIDPDQYVVLGAQRDAWGKGYARSTVGTSTLIELAKAIRDMVEKDGFRPRRSIVFASWSAGEYGSVGATEWLEAHMSFLGKNVLTYISLDGIVQGVGSFYASASPLLHTLLENTLRAVKSPIGSGSLKEMIRTDLFRPMSIDDPAYPFLAASGIPSISFHFISLNKEEYPFYNTLLDNEDHLNYATSHDTASVTASAAQIAGQMALRLVHDHVIQFDMTRYKKVLNINVYRINNKIYTLQKSGKLSDVRRVWLDHAKGSFQRAADAIKNDVAKTDLSDPEACRLLNDRIMRIERSLLSPYVSPIETPFRHLLSGQGPHTLAAIAEMTDLEQLHTQLALATWNLQGCANSIVENLWDVEFE
uniref:Transferrin receptor protein 1 n=1 Tax=Neogobius melanostomus TaxID=47308 RepID=A0A8C6UPZ7_9GOBI